MKHLLIAAIALITALAHAEDRKILGNFEAVPFDLLKAMPESVAAKMRQSFEKTKQTFTITDKDMTLSFAMGGGVYMTYTTHGDFLLGKSKLGDTELFYPIYIKDDDTLFFAGQKFVRVKEAK